ncbi:MAG: hypothetical protein DRP63_05435 [Planctomycetota bacterium]|nr:MAG: hypothetical protein DRP63_05435 [Planctomycetota bacterium]
MALEKTKEKLRKADTALAREALGAIAALEEQLKLKDRQIRRMRLDFETIIEVVSQVNARSLKTELIENFTLNTIMGQFAVHRAFIMRQENHLSDRIVLTVSKNVSVPSVSFKSDSPLARALIEREKPFRLRQTTGLLRYEEFRPIVETRLELCAPLIKRHENGDMELKGIIVLDKKFGRFPFSESDIDFLSLLSSMVAISLHNAQLYQRSIYDEMTQVFSRGHFDAHLFQEIERAKRYHSGGSPQPYNISLVMFDIDDFKVFNDKYGHQVGDTVLKAVAHAVKRSVRSSDVVARYGGEEFCVVLPETGKENAIRAAERIRKTVEGLKIATSCGLVGVTISTGVATYPDDASTMQELVREADKALYRAKALGKNRVEVAEGGKPSGDEE